MRKNEFGWKNGILSKKIHFSWNFKNPPKMDKKSSIFSKTIQTLFCFKITSICRKLIPKLASESSESKLCDYEAWNAPKFNLTLLARLKAQKYTFSAQISRILDFQNLKLARLKPVNKNKDLIFTMRSYDPKHTPPMISSHSDCFRALNAPFFCYHKFHIFAIKAQNYHFVSKISQIFYFQNLKLARLKPESKSKALTCTLCSYDPKEASNMISSHSDCFRALNAPFFLQPQISSFRI